MVCPSCGVQHSVIVSFANPERIKSKVLNMLRILVKGKNNYPVLVEDAVAYCVKNSLEEADVRVELLELQKKGAIYTVGTDKVSLV